MGKFYKWLLDGNKPITVVVNTVAGVAASIPAWIPQIRINKANKDHLWMVDNRNGEYTYLSDIVVSGDNHISMNGTFDYGVPTGGDAATSFMGPNDIATIHKIKALFVGGLIGGLLGLNLIYSGASAIAKRKAKKSVKGTEFESIVSDYLRKTWIPFAGKSLASNKLFSDLAKHYGIESLNLPEKMVELNSKMGRLDYRNKGVKRAVKQKVTEDANAPKVLLTLLGIKKPKKVKQDL